MGALLFPVIYWAIYRPPLVLLSAAILAGLLIVYRHKGNLARLRAGKENVFSLKGKANSGTA
jgi:glycerol-3-phosphate acyltransferase PlsY